MSSYRSSSNNLSTWRGLHDDKKAKLDKLGVQLPDGINDEALFCSSFVSLSQSLEERDYIRMLGQLQLGPINSFTNKVDTVEGLNPPCSLAVLVFGTVYAVIAAACSARIPLARIVELLGELHIYIPRVILDKYFFTIDTTIHVLLYQIFATYMDCLASVISGLNSEQPHPAIQISITNAIKIIKREGETFDKLVEKAGQSEVLDTRQYTSNWILNLDDEKGEHTARFQVGELLGRGSEGDVHIVQEISTKDFFARKSIPLCGSYGNPIRTEDQVRNEVAIMKKLVHPHIATVRFWLIEPGHCSIFMEVAESNLTAYLDKCSDFQYPESLLKDIPPWFGCLLNAIDFVHTLKIMHGDIKPSNILIKGGQIYLADFGEAKDFSQQANSMTSNSQIFGTAVYRAPEVTPGNLRGYEADMFSLGCVFSEMLSICSKKSLAEFQEWRKVSDTEVPFMFRKNLGKVREWISGLQGNDELIDPIRFIIKRMLIEDPQHRYTAQRSLSWLSKENSGVKFYCDYH